MDIVIVALASLAGLVLIVIIATSILSNYIITKNFIAEKDWEAFNAGYYDELAKSGVPGIVENTKKGAEYIGSLPHEEVSITSYDGLKLTANYYRNGDSKRTIVLVHGFKSDGVKSFASAFEFYRSLGLNFLLINMRSHAGSEGKGICFGVKERYDVRDWCRYLEREHPGDEVILGGISMGCSTVLMAAGLDDMPGNVIGIVADCGYTSPYDQFRHMLKDTMKLPTFPTLAIANIFCKLRIGFSFKEASTIDAVKKIKIPVLFIHGAEDKFVLPEFSIRNYEACASENKRLLIVPGAVHGMSYPVDTEGCQKALKDFIESL